MDDIAIQDKRQDHARPLTVGARSPDGVHANVVLFTIVSVERRSAKKTLPIRELQVALVRASDANGQTCWALPGSSCKADESIREGAVRALAETTGVTDVPLEYDEAYGDPGRDPRGWHISHAFLALSDESSVRSRLRSDAGVALVPVDDALRMPLVLDHGRMVRTALERVRRNMLTTTIARRFLPEEFTISELYQILETVVPEFEEKNFIRKITSTRSRKGILEEVRDRDGLPKTSNRYSQRAAQLYRFTDYEPRLSVYG